MKNTVTFLSIALLFAVSCKKSANSTDSIASPDSAPAKFAIDSIQVKDSLKIAKTLTLAFDKKILLFPDITDKTILDSIYTSANIKAKDFSKSALTQLLEQSKNEYLQQKDAKEYLPGFKQTWNENSKMKFISHQNDVLTVQYSGDGYSGGAHGYYFENYKMFDLKKNTVISQDDIFKNTKDPKWDSFLKNHFENKEQKVDLLVDKIELNNNFFFNDKKITFVYNQYEIAPYAAGVVYITFDFKEVKNQLKPEFLADYKIK